MTDITLTPCVSTQLAAHGYDAATQTLAIRFNGGGLYHYFDFPAATYEAFCKAPSLGSFFYRHIKAAPFKYLKMDDGAPAKQAEGEDTVDCPYCTKPAELVTGDVLYPHRDDLAGLYFWRCAPCGAHVGTHEGSAAHRPLGRLANAQLRASKMAAHAVFDPLWKSRKVKRTEAYAWLADRLGIKPSQCHIGEFDVDQCNAVVALVNSGARPTRGYMASGHAA